MSRPSIWLLPLTLGACGPALDSDEDADQLTYEEEQELGTDPEKADSDGDGLTDGQEVELGTDPTKNSYEAPYAGGWPRQAVEIKDAVEADGRSSAVVELGKRFPRMKVKDQHGEIFDLYDLARQGRPIVVDISAEWCPPCQAISGYLAGDPEWTEALGMDDQVYNQVQKGNLYWVTFLSENNDVQAPTFDVVQRWEETFPSEKVPVLLDRKQEMIPYAVAKTNAWPTILRLDEDMKVRAIAEHATDSAFYEVVLRKAKEAGRAAE